MLELENLIDTYHNFISHHMNYSLSGADRNILRRNGKIYQYPPQIANYNKLVSLFNKYDYENALKLMFDEGIGDCWHQSFVLAMMFKFTPALDQKYNIYIANSTSLAANQRHSFLLLIKRGANFPQLYNETSLSIRGQDLFNQENKVLITDPWADKYYFSITPINHPFDNLNFAEINLFLLNIDKCYMEFKKEFQGIYKRLFTNYLQSLVRIPLHLNQVIEDGQFEVTLRKASVSDKFLPVVKALVDFREILSIDITASGSAGTARDIALKYKCKQIIDYLDRNQHQVDYDQSLPEDIQRTSVSPC